jgi:hypothetical protein
VTTLKSFDIFSRKADILPKLGYGLFWLALFVASLGAGKNAYAQISCDVEITANVVVLDNPTVFNRLGAQNPNWISFALERDVINSTTRVPCSQGACEAGNVELRPDKRPRPLVVRSVEGGCLTVNFTNLLDPNANPNNAQQDQLFNNDQVAGRCAGFHATGTEVRNIDNGQGAMGNDGSMVGNNHPGDDVAANCGLGNDPKGGLVAPGESITYNLYTPHEGAFVINSYGATLGSESSSGNLGLGMFGALNVQPSNARMYRSQVTEEELRLATKPAPCDLGQIEQDGRCYTPLGQPIIDYEATYPGVQAVGGTEAACDAANPPGSIGSVFCQEGKANLKVLNMITDGVLQHSDINAIIVGPGPDGTWGNADDGPFPNSTYPLESIGKNNPPLPNRLEPFREFTSIYHDEQTNSQVFPKWYADPVLGHTLSVHDQLRFRRYRLRDHREPPAHGPDARLHRLRLRGILPRLADGRRPGRPGELPGQHEHRAV